MADCGEWFIVADREWVVTFDDRFHEIGTDFLELEAARSHPLFHGTAIAQCGGWGEGEMGRIRDVRENSVPIVGVNGRILPTGVSLMTSVLYFFASP